MSRLAKTDLELLADFRRGDNAAFQKLVRRHHLSLFNFFYALVRDASLADSLTRAAFLRISEEQRHFPGDLSFSLGMLRVGCECWHSYLRRTNAAPTLVSNRDESSSAKTDVAPAPAGVDAELLRCFESLPPELKLVLALSEVNGLSYDEITLVLEIPAQIVATRMAEGYAALRARLAAHAESSREDS